MTQKQLMSDRHPTVDLPAHHEGPRLPTDYGRDLCPVCGCQGMQPCQDDTGHDTTDHDGRPADYAASVGT
jgi:hypothetical protein